MALSTTGNTTDLVRINDVPAPRVYSITPSDLGDALRLGWEDFKAVPSHAVMLCLI